MKQSVEKPGWSFDDEASPIDNIIAQPLDDSFLSKRTQKDKEASSTMLSAVERNNEVLKEPNEYDEFTATEEKYFGKAIQTANHLMEESLYRIAKTDFVEGYERQLEVQNAIHRYTIEHLEGLDKSAAIEQQAVIEDLTREILETESPVEREDMFASLEKARAQHEIVLGVINHLGETYEMGVKDILADLPVHLLPFYSTQLYTEFAKDIFEINTVWAFGASSALDQMNEAFRGMSVAEKLEVLEKSTEWFETTGAGLISDTNLLTINAMLSEVFQRAEKGEDASVLEKRLADIVNALDVVGVGALIKGLTGTPAKIASLSQTSKSRAVMAARSDDAKAASMDIDTARQQMNEIIPAPGVSPVVLSREQQEIVDYTRAVKGYNLTDAQRAQLAEKLEQHMAYQSTALENKIMRYNHAKTKFVTSEQSFKAIDHYDTAIKVGNAKGLESLTSLVAAKFPDGSAKIVESNGRYVIKREQDISYMSEVKKLGDFGLPEGAALNNLFSHSQWQVPEARFHKDILKTLSFGRINKEISARVMDGVQAVDNLSASSQRKINDLLRKYSGVEIPAEELATLTPRERSAYGSFKESLDTMWAADNAFIRDYHMARGDMQLSIRTGAEGESVSYIGKPYMNKEQVSHLGSGPVQVYDPSSGNVVFKTTSEIYENNQSLFKLEGSEELGSSYVIVDRSSDTGSAAMLTSLPFTMLNYRPNYLPRYYDKRYIVQGVDEATGRLVAKAATNSRKEAETMAASYEGGAFKVAREFKEGVDDLVDIREVWGTKYKTGVAFGVRGDGLVDVTGKIAELDNSVEALTRAARSFGARHSLREHLEDRKAEWVKTYSHLLPEGQKVFPEDASAILGREGADGARSLHQYIQQLEGVKKSWTFEKWSNVLESFAKNVGDLIHPEVAKAINVLGAKDPTKGARALAFHLLLSTNPSRQLFMQAQHSLLTSALVPRAALPDMMSNGFYLQMASVDGISKDMKALWKTTASKTTGLSPKRFEELLKVYKDLGVRRVVTSHHMVDETLQSVGANTNPNISARVAQNLSKGVMFAPELAKTIGFDAGNHVNAMAAYMAAVTRYEDSIIASAKAAGKTLKRDEVDINGVAAMDAIRADMDKFLWYMGREGTAAYNDGALGVFMQFMTIQHKALVSMWPAKLGGRADMTAAEKARVGGALLALYGPEGFGVVNLLNKVQHEVGEENLPDDVKALLSSGILGRMIYDITGEETVFSSTFSPTSGLSPVAATEFMLTLLKDGDLSDMWHQLTNTHIGDGRQFFPSATALQKLTNASQTLHNIWRYDPDVFSTQEKINASIQTIASLSGTINNIEKMEIINRTGKIYTSSGKVLLETDQQRHIVAALLGVRSSDEDALTRAYQDLYHNVASVTKAEVEMTGRERGREFYDQIKMDMIRFKKDDEVGDYFSKAMLINSAANHLQYIDEDSAYRRGFLEGFHATMNSDAEEDAITRILSNVNANIHLASQRELDRVGQALTNISRQTGKHQDLFEIFEHNMKLREELGQSDLNPEDFRFNP